MRPNQDSHAIVTAHFAGNEPRIAENITCTSMLSLLRNDFHFGYFEGFQKALS